MRRLSERQRQILRLVATGREQKAIATALNLPRRTVEDDMRRVRERLEVATTLAAVVKAIKSGEIRLEEIDFEG